MATEANKVASTQNDQRDKLDTVRLYLKNTSSVANLSDAELLVFLNTFTC